MPPELAELKSADASPGEDFALDPAAAAAGVDVIPDETKSTGHQTDPFTTAKIDAKKASAHSPKKPPFRDKQPAM